jgi:prepilin-type N-terminal cleavage/methylation domain-containing protein
MFKQKIVTNQKGFSLTELMISMSIIGILIYAASSSIPKIANDYSYKSNVTKIDYMAKHAKLLAIQKSRYIGVCADYTNNKFIIKTLNYSLPTQTEGACHSSYSSDEDKVITLDGDYKIKNTGDYSQNFIFDSRGIAVQTATACIGNSSRYAQIIVTTSGLRVVKGEGAGCP